MEAVKTNVMGTDNVLTAAIEAGVKAVICLSTDKAAYPINAWVSPRLSRRRWLWRRVVRRGRRRSVARVTET